MKFLILFTMMFSIDWTARAEVPDGFTVYEVSPQRYMFENAKTHTTVIVNFEPVPLESPDVSAYISSHRFVQDSKNSRSQTSLGLSPDEPFSFHSGREHAGDLAIGVNEYEFMASEKSALVTERWFVRNGFSFTVLISSVGNQTPSADDHKAVFESFKDDLGLSKPVASLWDLAIPRAEAASELGRTTPSTSTAGSRRTTTQSTATAPAHAPVNCKDEAAKLGIAAADVRQGAPRTHLVLSGSACLAGAKQVVSDMKADVVGMGHAIAGAGQSVANRYKGNEDYLSRQMGCRGSAAPAAPAPQQRPRAVQAAQSSWDSWSDWVTQSQIWKSGTAMAKQASCAVASNVGAVVMTDLQYQKDMWNAEVKAAKAAGNLALKAGAAYAYYSDPRVQLTLMSQAIQAVRSTNTSSDAFASFMEKHSRGFTCMNDAAQTRFACKVATIAAREIGILVATAGTGAAISAGLRAARASRALVEAVEAVEVGTRVEQKAAAIRYAEEAANAGKGFTSKAAQKVLGRSLSKTELTAVENAHLSGAGGVGQYTKAELLKKIRILSDAGFSKEERNLLMRVGVTGQPPPALAAALAADAAGESTASAAREPSVHGEQRSIANEVLGAREDRPASFYRAQAATLEKESAAAIQEAKTTPIGLRSNVTQSRMHEMARAEMRAISPEDIAKTEIIADGNYVKMMKLSSHVDSQTATEAGEVVGHVIEALPAAKRAEFLESFNIQMTSANKAAKEAADAAAAERSALSRAVTERERDEIASRAESRKFAAAKEDLKFGTNYSATVNSVYQNVVRNGMGLTGAEDGAKVTELLGRLNNRSPAVVDAAVKEVLAAPGMKGIPAQEFRELRSTAAAAASIKNEAEKAATTSIRLEMSRQPALNAARKQGPDAVHKLRVQWAAEDAGPAPVNNGFGATTVRDLKPFGR